MTDERMKEIEDFLREQMSYGNDCPDGALSGTELLELIGDLRTARETAYMGAQIVTDNIAACAKLAEEAARHKNATSPEVARFATRILEVLTEVLNR